MYNQIAIQPQHNHATNHQFNTPSDRRGAPCSAGSEWTPHAILASYNCHTPTRERTYVPRYLCSPVPMLPGTYVPRTYVPRYLCSPNLCSPVPMFPGTYVPRFAVNDSSTPPRLIFLSLQIDMIIVIFALVVTVSVR